MRGFWKEKSVLVTGGTGLIGRALVGQLLDLGAKVTIVSLDKVSHIEGAEFVRADLTNREECLHLFENQDIVYHLAGIKASARLTIEKPATFFVPLLQMNTNVIEAAARNENPNIVFTSSIGAYAAGTSLSDYHDAISGEPMDYYPGWAKRMAELQLRALEKEFPKLSYTIIRPSNVYGPGDNFDPSTAMVIGSLLGRCMNHQSKKIQVLGQGKSSRDFVFSDDVATALVAVAMKPNNEMYNVGSGHGVTIKELVNIIEEVTGKELYFTNSDEPDYPIRVLEIQKIKNEYSWKPETSLRNGIEKTWNWLQIHSKEMESRHNYFNNKEGF